MRTPSLNTHVDAVLQALEKRETQGRTILAVAGPPASGKSTLAAALVARLNSADTPKDAHAVLLPMDGYHLDNSLLVQRGLLPRKGAPETFDAHGFCQAIETLHTRDHTLYFPSFDRARDLSVAQSVAIEPKTEIVVVEGNYLLLDTPPWNRVRPLFSLSVFLSPARSVLRERLVARWRAHGFTETDAQAKADTNDLSNADLVCASSHRADLHLTS